MKSIAIVSLVTASLGLGAAAVAAQPPVPPADMQFKSDNVLLVDTKKHKMHRKWVYSEKYGERYRHKRHG